MSFFLQLLIVSYREAKRINPSVATSLLDSFVNDYPGVQHSCLLPKWTSLANASLAFREVASTENKLLIWQQSCTLFSAYNEFLNGLLAYLIVLWRTAKGKTINTAVFSVPYANKINQFSNLTGGDDGAFYLVFRLAQPKLRNAVAHGTMWPDLDAGKVRYIDVKPPVENEISLIDFTGLCSVGSHLAQPYLAALALIAIMENGVESAKSLLPQDLVTLFDFASKNVV